MIDSNYIMSHPLPLVLLGAYFIPFAVAAFVAIFCRLLRRKVGYAEWFLLVLFISLVGIEYVQLFATGRPFGERADHFGLSRYFGVIAPFLWIFAASGAAFLWKNLRWLGKIGLVIALGWVLLKMNVGGIVEYKTKIQAHDTEVAVARLAPKIFEDYLGPREQRVIKRSLDEYFTGLRPVVSCPFGAAGWAVRGDHCHTTGVESPYAEDYLCYPFGSRYAGITHIDTNVYRYVTSVPGGLGTKWMLFRRRTTPGKAR